MLDTVRLVGIAHSKLRNAIGLVGIEVDPKKQEVQVKFAKHWDRSKINDIAPEIKELYQKFQWENTIIDLQVGEHLIDALRNTIPVRVIFIKRKVDKPAEIRRVKTLDLIEMVQFMLQMKLNHQIKFPTKPSEAMQELEDQIAIYSEHSTEAGGINYYSPGEELDDLTKALISVTFAARPMLQESLEIYVGSLKPSKAPSFEDLMNDKLPKPKRKRKIHGI